MNSVAESVLKSWTLDPGLLCLLALTGVLYGRGWLKLHRQMPPMYELALRSQALHEVEHVCFLATGILFWWPVIQPWPSRAQWPRWAMIPYLFLADFQNTALSAYLIFCDRVVYPTYAAAPR